MSLRSAIILGTKTKIHKGGMFIYVHLEYLYINDVIICTFYYTLGNILPQFRFQLKSIHLLAIAKSSLITKYGPDTVLSAFCDDLKILEEVHNSKHIHICLYI